MTIEFWLEKSERNLKTARLILADGDPASACNRAYYSMFNAARAALAQAGQTERAAGKTHNGIISSFGEFLVQSGKIDAVHGRNFSRESNRRLLCDYEDQEIRVDDAAEAISNAEAFVAAVWQMRQADNSN